MLAAIDGDALYQIVILVLLGGGSLVKSILEKKRKGEAAEKGEALRGSSSGRTRVQTRRRLNLVELELEEYEDGSAPQDDPWKEILEREASPAVEEPVRAQSAPTPKASIEGPGLEGRSFEGSSFDGGALAEVDWEPGGRIREAVEEDIKSKVAADITEHVAADMSGGVRGGAKGAEETPQRSGRASRGWRDAVIAAEILAAPIAIRDAAGQPAGLRNG